MLGTVLPYDPQYYSTNTFLYVQQSIKDPFKQDAWGPPQIDFRQHAFTEAFQQDIKDSITLAMFDLRFTYSFVQQAQRLANSISMLGVALDPYVGSAIPNAIGITGLKTMAYAVTLVVTSSPIIRFIKTDLDVGAALPSVGSVYPVAGREAL